MAQVFASAPWYRAAHDLSDGERFCTCCKRDLAGHAVRMLELDQRTNTYHDARDVPESKSQGWFPFGLACAKKMIKQHERATLTREAV